MGKITVKNYYCPACGNKEKHSTNHFGEIYSSCKKCKNTVLYCKDIEREKPESECKIVFYKFCLEDTEQKNQYKQLKKALTAKGYKMFNALTTHSAFEALRQHNDETIGLYNVKQFDNQIVSTIGRVFYWYEAIWSNKKIKSGYYLEF
jgi:hypothetical protein